MDDAGVISKLEKPAPLAANGAEALAVTFGDTFDRTSAIFDAGLRFWQTEYLRFVSEAAADGRAAVARLSQSKTPLDVFSAEQEFLRARSRSFLEAGVRFIDAFAAPAQCAKADDAHPAKPPRKARQGVA